MKIKLLSDGDYGPYCNVEFPVTVSTTKMHSNGAYVSREELLKVGILTDCWGADGADLFFRHSEFEFIECEHEESPEEMKRRENLDCKRMKKYLKRIKPKLRKDIEWLINDLCSTFDFSMVRLEDIDRGKRYGVQRCSGRDLFGFSTAVRHAYSQGSYCSYSDFGFGTFYIYVGEGRYLKFSYSE